MLKRIVCVYALLLTQRSRNRRIALMRCYVAQPAATRMHRPTILLDFDFTAIRFLICCLVVCSTRCQRLPAVRRAAQVHRGQSRPGHIAHVQNRRQARNVLLAEGQQGNSGTPVEAPSSVSPQKLCVDKVSVGMRMLFATCKQAKRKPSVTQFRNRINHSAGDKSSSTRVT